MKRCPTCNQTFSEGWLSFCTQDGTTLIEDSVSQSEPLDPMATMMAPPPPPLSKPDLPASWNTPSGGLGSGSFPQQQPAFQQPQPIQAGWQAPPPPAYATPKQGLAIASLIAGIFSMTFGWCCSIGVLTSIAAIVMGGISLTRIKNDPEHNTGKPFALVGIITAALYLVFWVLIILLWGIGTMMGGLK